MDSMKGNLAEKPYTKIQNTINGAPKLLLLFLSLLLLLPTCIYISSDCICNFVTQYVCVSRCVCGCLCACTSINYETIYPKCVLGTFCVVWWGF